MEETLEKRRKLLSKAKDLEEQHNYANQMDAEIERVKYRARKRLDVITTAIELVQKKLSAKNRLASICAQFPEDVYTRTVAHQRQAEKIHGEADGVE